MMKAVLITYNVAIDDEVMEALEGVGAAEHFTRIERVVGQGAKSGPHFGTHVWPASNSAILIVTEEQKAAEILDSIRRLREKLAKEGVKAFCWTIDEVT